MHLILRILSLEVPTDKSAIDTTGEYHHLFKVKCATHDVLLVHICRISSHVLSWRISALDVAIQKILIILLFYIFLICWVFPDMELLIPANTQEARVFDFWLLKVIPTKVNSRVIDADQRGYFSINSWIIIRAHQLI